MACVRHRGSDLSTALRSDEPDFHRRPSGFRYKGCDLIDRDSLLRGFVISRLLRWSARILLVLLVLVVTALIGFRLAAAFRETASRDS